MNTIIWFNVDKISQKLLRGYHRYMIMIKNKKLRFEFCKLRGFRAKIRPYIAESCEQYATYIIPLNLVSNVLKDL